jgi:hypothetical protein
MRATVISAAGMATNSKTIALLRCLKIARAAFAIDLLSVSWLG